MICGIDPSNAGRVRYNVPSVVLTPVALAPRVRWWTKLARLPRFLWSQSAEVATMITDHSPRQPSRRKLAWIRIAMLACRIVVLPFALVLRRRFRPRGPTAFEALDTQMREVWRTSPYEAVALLRSIFERLLARGALNPIRTVEIEPYGKFEPWDALAVERHLYNCEITLGHHEAALAVAPALPKYEETILQQVDCLVAMGRRPDAIALLERSLDVDGWRGTLRRRLRELGGSPLKSVN
jgi:hypothetical protein